MSKNNHNELYLIGHCFTNYPTVKQDKHEQMDYPCHTKTWWKGLLLVFGDSSKPIQHGYYSDRLRDWDREADERGRKAVKDVGYIRYSYCGASVELYLSEYYQKRVEIVWVKAGYKPFSGNPYWQYGFNFID